MSEAQAPMRVLVVTDAHPPQDARIWYRECGALRAAGHQVTMVAPFSAFGVTHEEVRTIDVSRSVGGVVPRLRAVAATTRVLLAESGGHDLVIVHDPELLPTLGILWLQRLARRSALPVLVWDDHEDVPAQMHQIGAHPVVAHAGHAVLRGIELVAERLFKVTLAEFAYQERFALRHPVVPNSTDVPDEVPRPADEHPRVVYLGALTWVRGAQELIDLARLVPEMTVEIIGNAKDDVDAALRSACAELPNLRYHGFVPNVEALRKLPGALAGLSMVRDHPNARHSQLTKLMEYMAYGVPIVTTPNQASADLVRSAGAGFVVDFGDVAAAADALRRLDADRGLRDRMGRAGHEVGRREHNWRVDGPAFVRALAGWVAEARGRGAGGARA